MSGKTVNLDALIPRDDFVSENTKAGGSPRQTISISDLDSNGFFQNSLRKPDFQRETTHWAPSSVADLIRAFIDGDLIPAVILWERGEETFVIESKESKSAAFIREALANPIKCAICGGAIHRNSITFDHIARTREGGSNRSENLTPTHPYCNSGYKG